MRSPSCKSFSFLVALMLLFRVAAVVLCYPMKVLAAILEGNRRTRPDAQFQRAIQLPGWNPMRKCILFVLLLAFAAIATSKGFGTVQIYTTSLPKGLVDTSYSAAIGASNGCTPFTWSITNGSLPAGLSGAPASNTQSFLITGIPTTVGSSTFTVQVKGCGGGISSQVYTLAINQTSGGPYWSNSCTSTITANFNGTPIPGGSSIWFTSSLTPASLPTSPGSLYIHDFNVSFSANGTNYSCYNHPPVDELFFTNTDLDQLIYYQGSNSWISNLPLGLSGNTFLAPCILAVPTGGLPGGIGPVTWQMTFESNTRQPINWQWAAAVYSQFPTAQEAGCGSHCVAGGETGTLYQEVGAKPTDDSNVSSQTCTNPSIPGGSGTTTCSAAYSGNSDPVGTPEGVNINNQPWKDFLIGGATGGGGSTWTGSRSGVGSCTPTP
jgi:hypothetical protein